MEPQGSIALGRLQAAGGASGAIGGPDRLVRLIGEAAAAFVCGAGYVFSRQPPA